VTIKGVEEMNYRIERKPEFQMFGKEKIISATDGRNFIEIPGFWQDSFADGTVEALCKATGEQCGEDHRGRYLVHAVMCYRQTGEGTFPYMIGGMITEKCNTYDFETVTIPELEWALFTTDYYTEKTLVEAIQSVWKRIFTEWFPTTGYAHAGGPELEVYCTDGPGKDYCEIWIPVIRK
jgi:AraC family transcriptional regulator